MLVFKDLLTIVVFIIGTFFLNFMEGFIRGINSFVENKINFIRNIRLYLPEITAIKYQLFFFKVKDIMA